MRDMKYSFEGVKQGDVMLNKYQTEGMYEYLKTACFNEDELRKE